MQNGNPKHSLTLQFCVLNRKNIQIVSQTCMTNILDNYLASGKLWVMQLSLLLGGLSTECKAPSLLCCGYESKDWARPGWKKLWTSSTVDSQIWQWYWRNGSQMANGKQWCWPRRWLEIPKSLVWQASSHIAPSVWKNLAPGWFAVVAFKASNHIEIDFPIRSCSSSSTHLNNSVNLKL